MSVLQFTASKHWCYPYSFTKWMETSSTPMNTNTPPAERKTTQKQFDSPFWTENLPPHLKNAPKGKTQKLLVRILYSCCFTIAKMTCLLIIGKIDLNLDFHHSQLDARARDLNFMRGKGSQYKMSVSLLTDQKLSYPPEFSESSS